MRSAFGAVMAVVAALVIVNMLGVAAAEAPTTGSAVRTVSVEGIAMAPIAQGSNASTATAVYRQAMEGAISDGHGKAEFLASKAGATLGSVQSIVEGGGYIGCTPNESGEAEYQGEQPDFGSPVTSISGIRVSPGVATPKSPALRRPAVKHGKRKLPAAKKASSTACTLTAQVSLAYSIS
jgi:hypothetical protein